MSNIHKIVYVCTVLLLFCGCAKIVPYVPYTTMNPAEMQAVSRLAVELTEMVKKDVPLVPPYMNIDSSRVDVEKLAGYDHFFVQNMVILDADFSAERIFSQQTLVESVDRLGRIDLRDDRIAFKVREPNAQEVHEIGKSFEKYFSKSKIRKLSKSEQTAFKDAIRTYQKDNGLASDGVFGKNTAKSLAEKAPIADIKEVSSKIVYPVAPRHATYVVPFSIVNQNSDKFYKGFSSLEAVKQNAISSNDFQGLAKTGAKFTVFVYFFDRVDPYYPLSVRLSASKLKATGSAGQRWYADPVEWPVLVETFTLNKDPGTALSSLYLSVCIETDTSNKCISSRKLQ